MFLIDTNVISEYRKGSRANPGVQNFFGEMVSGNTPAFISAVTIGELRRGVEMVRHRGDIQQAAILERWLDELLIEYGERILNFTSEIAQVWGRLRVPHPENELDKQIAATALVYGLTVVTRNDKDFLATDVQVINPFLGN